MKMLKKVHDMIWKEEPKIIFSSTRYKEKEEFNPSSRHEEPQEGGMITFDDLLQEMQKGSIRASTIRSGQIDAGHITVDDLIAAQQVVSGHIAKFNVDPAFFEVIEEAEDPSKR